MNIHLISAPYHLGRPGVGMALGPGRILAELPEFEAREIVPARSFSNEVASTFDVNRAVAAAVREAAAASALPIALSANCMAGVGSVAGLQAAGAERVGVIWLDAHGDFNTAATTPSGYVDGTALATAAGLDWQRLARSIDGFRPVEPAYCIHVGGRDFDEGEREAMLSTGVEAITTAGLERMGDAFDRLAGRVDAVYLHLDVDVLDVSEGLANGYACPGGLSRAGFDRSVALAFDRLPVRAVGFAAYDPAFDPEGSIARIAADTIESVARR